MNLRTRLNNRKIKNNRLHHQKKVVVIIGKIYRINMMKLVKNMIQNIIIIQTITVQGQKIRY